MSTAAEAPRAGAARYLRSMRLPLCAAAIICSLLLYAVIQERIMSLPYRTGREPPGDKGQPFGSSFLIVLTTRLLAAAIAAAILLFRGDAAELRNRAPLHKYFMVSVSNVCATSCQYEALRYLTFPTATLFKCAKMISVMLWGSLILGKSYGVVEYAVGALVAAGCTVFLVSGNIVAKKAAASDSWFGLLLMLGYLAFDGFTSTFQEKLFKGYSMSIYNQMLYVNLCSSVISFLFLAVSGKMVQSVAFLVKYPAAFKDMLTLSVSAVSGQFAITYTIKQFGALVYATIMTIRQFLSVFLSNLYYGHKMNARQWLGATIVFTSLFYKSYAKANRPRTGPKVELARADQEETAVPPTAQQK